MRSWVSRQSPACLVLALCPSVPSLGPTLGWCCHCLDYYFPVTWGAWSEGLGYCILEPAQSFLRDKHELILFSV